MQMATLRTINPCAGVNPHTFANPYAPSTPTRHMLIISPSNITRGFGTIGITECVVDDYLFLHSQTLLLTSNDYVESVERRPM